MNKRSSLIILALLCIPSILLSECQEQKVKVVSSLPLTGSANAQMTTVVNAIKMAIDEANEGCKKYHLEYESWDDASPQRGTWDPAVEAANADKAIADKNIIAYIGTFNSGAAKISIPKLNKAGLLMISPGNTWPGLTKPGIGEANEPMVYQPSGKINYFRVVPADDVQGPAAAGYANEIGAKSVYVLHDREVYGQGVSGIFKTSAEKNNIKILGYEGIDIKASNYKSLAVKIRSLNPDLVYFGGTTQSNAGQLVKDLRAIGYKKWVMLPDGCFETAFIQSAGANNLNGNTLITFGGVPPALLTGKGQEFYQKYKSKFGGEPEAFAVYGYEAALVITAALDRSLELNRPALIDAISATSNFEGTLGNWSFDKYGDTSLRTISVNKVENGSFQFIKQVSYQ